jgi:hypothetical protein
MKRIVPISLMAVFFAGRIFADTLEPSAGAAVEGFFLSYDKGKINFMGKDQKTRHETPSGVKKLTLDKPLKGSVESKMKRGAKEDVTVSGFEQGCFLVQRAGKDEKIPLQTISALHVDAMANNRTMDQLAERDNVISQGEEVDLKNAVEQGKVTVIQFHLPGALASEREGNYLDTLEKRNAGKLVVKRAVVKDAGAPIAKQYDLKTFPQFWFYGRTGQLVTKLTDRFTETDINEAIKKASK